LTLLIQTIECSLQMALVGRRITIEVADPLNPNYRMQLRLGLREIAIVAIGSNPSESKQRNAAEAYKSYHRSPKQQESFFVHLASVSALIKIIDKDLNFGELHNIFGGI